MPSEDSKTLDSHLSSTLIKIWKHKVCIKVNDPERCPPGVLRGGGTHGLGQGRKIKKKYLISTESTFPHPRGSHVPKYDLCTKKFTLVKHFDKVMLRKNKFKTNVKQIDRLQQAYNTPLASTEKNSTIPVSGNEPK